MKGVDPRMLRALVELDEIVERNPHLRWPLSPDAPDPSWSEDAEGYVVAPLVNRGTLDAADE